MIVQRKSRKVSRRRRERASERASEYMRQGVRWVPGASFITVLSIKSR
jgi:hypothetical protein